MCCSMTVPLLGTLSVLMTHILLDAVEEEEDEEEEEEGDDDDCCKKNND